MFIINVNRLIKILYKLIFIYNYLKKVLQNQKKLFIFVQRIWIMKRVSAGLISVFGLFLLSCSTLDSDSVEVSPKALKLNFDISVLRDGVKISEDNGAVTKSAGDSSASVSNMLATMDVSIPFALIGIETQSRTLLIDNILVSSGNSGKYETILDGGLLEIQDPLLFSAYYPRVSSISYENSHQSYSIPYELSETEAGPLVSKTVERSFNLLNTLPLEFCHITNDIGFRICDVTSIPQLQGLIHLRKLVATHVASAGVYVNDILLNNGIWNYQGYYRDVTVFEGDALVGVGNEGKRYVGKDALVDSKEASHRFYAVPDQIEMGVQYVEVHFDVDGFSIGGEEYLPMKDQVLKYMIYGLLPGNTMIPGKQYTFHIGMDLSSLYHPIDFSASVSGWETKIYESNQDF